MIAAFEIVAEIAQLLVLAWVVIRLGILGRLAREIREALERRRCRRNGSG